VIVESPAKARTINKYLGKDFVVQASMGHVRDLPQKSLGIDLEKQFKPEYQILPSRKKVVNQLQKAAEKARKVYLATDLDREGEAIAWHLAEALKLDPDRSCRVIFNEITARAIKEAFAHPHRIDEDKVNAQQARRILDRLVGYQLSPLLWKKVAKGLSAGRVQSVAVRLIVEREREIAAFKPEEYWRIHALLLGEGSLEKVRAAYEKLQAQQEGKPDNAKWDEFFQKHRVVKAELVEFDGQKPSLGNEQQASQIKALLDGARYHVAKLDQKRRQEKPPAPLTTAALQQQAANQLRFSTSRTMRIAQQLYEGVELGEEGSVALITYMRTDSRHLAPEAVAATRDYIRQHFGAEYLPEKPNVYASKGRAQEAHEAIRPTDVTRTPEQVKQHLSADQYKLYNLIWSRTVASQAKPAVYLVSELQIKAASSDGRHEALLRATGRRLVFDGFLKIVGRDRNGLELPPLKENQAVELLDVQTTQHFTQPPPRYNEASLVRTLEAEGIGRPSTYATIISTIQQREYVKQIDRKFHATELGMMVTDKLMEHFPKIMDVKFTSHMEDQLDKIEEAHLDWVAVLNEFYGPFKEALDHASENMVKESGQESPYKCKQCDRPMVYRWTKSGRFLACSGYPQCRYICSIDEQGKPIEKDKAVTDHSCPKCGKPMVLRQSRYGPFLGCSDYPQCTETIRCDEAGEPVKRVKPEDVQETCDQCGKPMVARKARGRGFLACSGYPECKNTKPLPKGIQIDWPEPKVTDVKCDKCGKPMVLRHSRRGPFLGCSGFPKCRNTQPIKKDAAQQKATTPGAR